MDLRDFIYLFSFSVCVLLRKYADKGRSKDFALYLKQKVQRSAKGSLIHN